jgi:hypothetical protein
MKIVSNSISFTPSSVDGLNQARPAGRRISIRAVPTAVVSAVMPTAREAKAK